ncbi:hypothetical protein UFOVP116_307 [uncultured Caudovirales phage]|uniref:Uncharacterized protein n=1 Tax=uncultured Caudovirales phage TaxID=2100421 RepID=A0A6J5L838_9CAUD|nr:hypothetical protein UFOVP116_307 [uncultured Caudovirales phage]
MAYTRPPNAVNAGTGLIQDPVGTAPPGVIPVKLSAKIATPTELGAVKIGANISVTPDGVISTSGGSVVSAPWQLQLTANGSAPIQINNLGSRYCRTGDLVICTFNIEITGLPANNSQTQVTIANLPFSGISGSTATGHAGALCVAYFASMNDNVDSLSGTVRGNTTICDFWHLSEQKKSLVPLVVSAIKVSTKLAGSITYFTQDA